MNMNPPCRQKVSDSSVIFFVSSLIGAGCRSGLMPVPLAVAVDGSMWAAATDLRIEPEIMNRILHHPEPAHFYYAQRIFVNLQVVTEVCEDEILAFRVRSLLANCLRLRHPAGFTN